MFFVPLHAFGGAKDLPLPLNLFILAAGAALLLSFLILVKFRRSEVTKSNRKILPLPVSVLKITFGVVGTLLSAAFLYALYFGENRANNPSIGIFFVLLWVGLIPLSLIFGNVYKWMSFTNNIGLLLDYIRPTPGKELSKKVGYWPATLIFFAFFWQELVNPGVSELDQLKIFVGAYLLIVFIGVSIYGSKWVRSCDPFVVYAEIVSHMSLFDYSGKKVVVRNPLQSIRSLDQRAGLVPLLTLLFGSTIYDSIHSTPLWDNVTNNSPLTAIQTGTVSLLVIWALIAILFRLGCGIFPIQKLICSLVPITMGYMLAHYLTYFFYQGQTTVNDIFSILNLKFLMFTPSVWLLKSPMLIAEFKVFIVLLGHIVGTIVIHDQVLSIDKKSSFKTQLPMLILMLLLTTGGLFLLFKG